VGLLPIPIEGSQKSIKFGRVDIAISSEQITSVRLSENKILLEGTRNLINIRLDGQWKKPGEDVGMTKVSLVVVKGDAKKLFNFLRDTSSTVDETPLLGYYRVKYPHNPEGVFHAHIERLTKEGKTRGEAIIILRRQFGIN
jgi:hypothetical protein